MYKRQVKEHAAQAIRGLKAEGVEKTVMLTGDADAAARQVASQLGVDEVDVYKRQIWCRPIFMVPRRPAVPNSRGP